LAIGKSYSRIRYIKFERKKKNITLFFFFITDIKVDSMIKGSSFILILSLLRLWLSKNKRLLMIS